MGTWQLSESELPLVSGPFQARWCGWVPWYSTPKLLNIFPFHRTAIAICHLSAERQFSGPYSLNRKRLCHLFGCHWQAYGSIFGPNMPQKGSWLAVSHRGWTGRFSPNGPVYRTSRVAHLVMLGSVITSDKKQPTQRRTTICTTPLKSFWPLQGYVRTHL